MTSIAGFSGKTNVFAVVLLLFLGGYIHFLYISKYKTNTLNYRLVIRNFSRLDANRHAVLNCRNFSTVVYVFPSLVCIKIRVNHFDEFVPKWSSRIYEGRVRVASVHVLSTEAYNLCVEVQLI